MSSVNNPGLGSEFEVLLPPYLALKLLKNEEIKDFRMRSNVKGIEKFDDVLIDLEMENGHQHHLAIQLKHKERKHGKLLPSSFHTGTDFNLEKYCEAYHKLDSDEYKCVIFTNASFDSKKLKDVNKFTMALSENDFVNNLLNSDIDNGNVYKFEVNEETDNKEKFEKFFQQFFLFVAQNNTKELEDRIKNIFENEYSATDVKISTEFINLFRKWHKRQFTNDTLDRKTLSVHLVDLLLENFLIKSSNGIINRDKKLNLLENCVRMFDVTVIEDLKVKFVSDMGKCEDTNCLPSYIDKAVKKLAKDFEIVDDCLLRLAKEHKFVDRNSRELKLQEKVKIFNYLCGKPLIINYDEKSKDQVAKVLEMDFKTSIKMNFVLVGKEIDQTQFNNLKIFKTLQDLRRGNNPLYQKIINEINISVQGRENIKLEKIITSYPELTNIIKVKHLCQDEHLKVGEKLEELPEYYIPRKVSVAVLDDVNILEELINKNHLLVINYRREKQYLEKIATAKSVKLIDIDKFMKENGYLKNMKNEEKYIVVTREMCIKDKFDKICNMTNDNVFFLKINKERKFILIKSKNDEIKTTFLNEIEALINFSHGINVICAEPGMGKTSLMKNFRHQCSSDQWTVFVELRQFGSLFDQSEFKIDEILNNFFKKTDEDVIASEMRNMFLKKNRITFFLDGLDELESKCIDNLLIFVKQLKEKGFTVWLSSRNNIKDKIERELNLFSIDVNEANEEQQKEYINSRLKPYNYSEDEINQIIDNIFVSVGIQNNASILGIPLQLFMLTQIFIDDKSSNQNNSKLTEKQFILTKLYKKYFEGKIKHSLQKDGLTNESNIKRIAKAILKDYQISALRSCLDEEDFKILNVKQSELHKDEKFINEVKKNGDNYGIIKNVNENKTVTFVHHTHAEYFTAIYLSENVDKVRILGESFLSQKYDNLRLLFDIKLAEDKPLHLSIIYRNLDQFNEIIKNGCDLKDKGGRTPLHLACVCGTKYSPLKYKEDEHYYDVPSNVKDENDSFMKITDKLVELCPVMTKDEIFEWDEIDYTTKCWSLYPLQEILKQQQNEQDLNQVLEYKRRHWILKIIDFRKYTPSENWENKLNLNENKEAIAYYSVRFGYQILLKILLVCCDFSLNEWKYEQTRDTLLHQACTKGHKEIVHLLFNHGAKVNIFDSHESTPLHYACMYGHIAIALFLIQNDAEVNRIDADLDTSLYLACKNGHKETAHLLIKNKADVNSVGRNSYTPLHRVCLNGHTEIALLLIQNSANINSVDEDGDTPLHCACLKGHTEIALLLIQNNADVNSVGGYGYTPLHRACLNGYTEIVLLLIQNSANINSVDEDGDTSRIVHV